MRIGQTQPVEWQATMRDSMAAKNGLRTGTAGRRRDKFAARLATIVLRWRTVCMQEPDSSDTGLWMSRPRRGKAPAQP
jgi:hypothetical protein